MDNDSDIDFDAWEKDIEIQTFVRAAEKMLEGGNIDRAIRLAKKALKIDPLDTRTLLCLAKIYPLSKKPGLAEECYQKVLAKDPGNLSALEGYGVYLIESDRKAEGIEYLKTFFKKTEWQEGNSLGAFIQASFSLNKDENVVEAFKYLWEKSLSQIQGFRYAHQLRHKGDCNEAIPILQMISRYKPKPVILNELGLCLGEISRWQEAASAFEQAAKTKIEQGGNNGEIKEFDSSLADYSTYWGNLSYALLIIQENEKALKAAEKAIEVYDQLFFAWERRLYVLAYLNQYEEIVDVAQEIIKRFTVITDGDQVDLSDVFVIYANALGRLGRNEEAIGVLENGWKKYKGNWRVPFALIDLLIEKKDYQKALDLVELPDKIDISADFDLRTILFCKQINAFGGLNRAKAIRPAVEALLQKFPPENPDWMRIAYENILIYLGEDFQYFDELIGAFADLTPASPFFVMAQAEHAFHKEEYPKAKELLERALFFASSLEDLEDRLNILNGLGYIYLELGDPVHARQILKEPVSLEPFGNFQARLGWHGYLKNGKIIFEEKASIIYAARVNLATSYLMEGNFEQAYEVVSGLISAEKDNMVGPAYALLGYIDLARGDKQAARIAWKIALKNGYDPDRMNAEISELDAELKKPAPS